MKEGFLEADTLKSDKLREKVTSCCCFFSSSLYIFNFCCFQSTQREKTSVFWDRMAIFSLFFIFSLFCVWFYSSQHLPFRLLGFFCPCQSSFFSYDSLCVSIIYYSLFSVVLSFLVFCMWVFS